MNPSLSPSCQLFGGSSEKTRTHPGTVSKIDLSFFALFSQFVLSCEEYGNSSSKFFFFFFAVAFIHMLSLPYKCLSLEAASLSSLPMTLASHLLLRDALKMKKNMFSQSSPEGPPGLTRRSMLLAKAQ